MTTAETLRDIITTWPDLRTALETPTTTIGGLGLGLRTYLARSEHYDLTEALALRALERNPAQLGTRPVPMNLRVYDTMHAIRAVLATLADQTAAEVQIEPTPFPGREWPAEDRARRTARARADLADPKRWRFRGTRPDAPYTALWLLARVEHRPGPFRPLSQMQEQRIGRVARQTLHRIEATLDLADDQRELAVEHPCQCGGRIEVHGGAGAQPVARCQGCGAIWSEAGIIAS